MTSSGVTTWLLPRDRGTKVFPKLNFLFVCIFYIEKFLMKGLIAATLANSDNCFHRFRVPFIDYKVLSGNVHEVSLETL